jgi:glutamate/tyrosine decarboxylase-like PLP-dependent enzyme
MDLQPYLQRAVEAVREWESEWGSFRRHPSTRLDEAAVRHALSAYTSRLRRNCPFFHPRYAGQMLKPPHPAAVVGYLAAMLINPNNHAMDGGRPTSEMEKEVVARIAAMFGFPAAALGHLTSSGTIANLEAAWVARETNDRGAVAVSDQGHYTHGRLADLLRIDLRMVPSDDDGRMRLDVLEPAVRRGEIGTVVMTAGTTALGAVDPIADVVEWRDRYGIRVHVDAAYGGFFALAAGDDSAPLEDETRRHLQAIADCDSVVVDPHKHGLQPYGCGCILFRDPAVGSVYRHDAPYTYFTSADLHLGEISFECSRPGAAAGALWLTLELLPLRSDEGLGPMLSAGLRAARAWHALLLESHVLRPYMPPELDIVTYFPEPAAASAAGVSQASQEVFERGAEAADEAFFLSVLRLPGDQFARRHSDLETDADEVRILRSVLMKPEHEAYVELLHRFVTDAAAR